MSSLCHTTEPTVVGNRLICACRIGDLNTVIKLLQQDKYKSQINKELSIRIPYFDHEHRQLREIRDIRDHERFNPITVYFTPLQAAINYKRTDIVRYLVNNYQTKLDLIGKTDADNQNSLHFTAYALNEDTEILSILINGIEKQTNKMQIINQQTFYEVCTPLDLAYMMCASDEFIKLFKENGATANHFSPDGKRIKTHFAKKGGFAWNVKEIFEEEQRAKREAEAEEQAKKEKNRVEKEEESTILRF